MKTSKVNSVFIPIPQVQKWSLKQNEKRKRMKNYNLEIWSKLEKIQMIIVTLNFETL